MVRTTPMVRAKCLWAWALIFSLIPFTALAQIPSSVEPGRERERFVEQPAPRAEPAGPTISLPTSAPPAGAESIQMFVRSVQLVGSTVYSEANLAVLSSDLVGRTVAVAAIYNLAQQITSMYGADGYVLSRAVVPPQDIDPADAVITIRIVEGYVDRVAWPASLSEKRDFFSDYSARITGERPANINTIMRYLLLAGDLPGIDVSSRFEASAANTAASTLIVEAEFKPLDAEARTDNRGTQASGPYQFLFSTTANNILDIHEALTVSYAGAFELSELQYIALGYRQVVNSEGLTIFSDFSFNWGEPGTTDLKALEFKSESLFADLGMFYPVIRSRDKNLTLSGMLFLSEDRGDILSNTSSDVRLLGLRLSASFDVADRLNGITQLVGTFSQGIEGLGSTSNDNPNASRANGRVDFTKVNATISRVQPLANGFSYRLAVSGQYAFDPLLASEECGYGGREIGRAFYPSEITGDSCVSVLGELRFDLPETPTFSMAQLYVFLDYGTVYNFDPAAGTPKNRNGASAGLGLRFSVNDRLRTDISAAKPLKGRNDEDWRFFFTARARY